MDMCDEVIGGRIGNSVSSGEGTEVHEWRYFDTKIE